MRRNTRLWGNCEGRRGGGVDRLQYLQLLYTGRQRILKRQLLPLSHTIQATNKLLTTASTRRLAGHLVLASRSAAVGYTAQLRSMCMRM